MDATWTIAHPAPPMNEPGNEPGAPTKERASPASQGVRPALLPDLFAEVAARCATLPALEVPAGHARALRQSRTYAQLERDANAVASALAPFLVELEGAECVVALRLPRASTWLFAAEIGVWRAGAAVLVLEPSFPMTHARFLLADSAARVLITDRAGLQAAAELGVSAERVVAVEDLEPQALSIAPARAPAALAPERLAYVIYTSGTTGKPKGVLCEHRGIANLIDSDIAHFGLSPADRVAQGSSHAYDSSLEETWMALSVGACVVVLDDDDVRAGPDLVDWLKRERISVFCPPPTLLRATGCADPQRALPDLRLVYVGGEAMPEDLAARWARGRRLENGYGPTECSVTVVRARLEPGAPVVIGRPVPNHRAHVLDEHLSEVPDGEVGELAIAGIGLARGYLNLPELTSQRFVEHAQLGRLYLTGDLARRGADGALSCLGRRDAQVKVRGHRIELGAIESELARLDGVRAAAARVQLNGHGPTLVAFAVPEMEHRGGALLPCALDPLALRTALAARLPAPMVPARIAVIERLPTTVGGKLDRAALPALDLAATPQRGRTPQGELERALALAVRETLHLSTDVSADADFFVDLGGDSLAAAELVSRLRAAPRSAAVTVRDLYEARSVAALARRLEARSSAPEPAEAPPRTREPRGVGDVARPRTCAAVQALVLAAELAATSALAWGALFVLLPWALRTVGLPGCVAAATAVASLSPLLRLPLGVAATALAKRALLGRYRAERMPVWSARWLRHWIVLHVARTIPWSLVRGTELAAWVLRALGARVGRRVHVHDGVELLRGGWDLLEIGDDATLEQDAELHLVELDRGELVCGPIAVGERSVVGVRAALAPDSSLGADARLEALSWLPPGAHAGAGERWGGVPAERLEPSAADAADAADAMGARASARARNLSPAAFAALSLAEGCISAALGWAPFALAAAALALAFDVDGHALSRWLRAPTFRAEWVLGAAACAVAAQVARLLGEALWARALGRVQPGLVGLRTLAWLVAAHKIASARRAGDWLSGSLWWPHWLRLAGMRVGRNGEISTLVGTLPDLVEIGPECFLADGVYLAPPALEYGVAALRATRLGARGFFGNHAVVECGAHLGDDVLVGVSTLTDARMRQPGGAWFGRPALELARRPQVAFERSLTHDPGPWRYAQRLVCESARLVLAAGPVLALAWWTWLCAPREIGLAALWRAPAVSLSIALAAVACVWAAKWILLGRVRPGAHPLWSWWCNRWDFHYMLWSLWGHPFLAALEGTPFLVLFLRAMGARIGSRVVLGGGFAQVVDPDMLHFEDGASVSALLQAHSFEDRVLQIDRVHLRPGASAMESAVLFYGTEIGAGSRVLPHGVLMKHERLEPDRDWAGSPLRPLQG